MLNFIQIGLNKGQNLIKHIFRKELLEMFLLFTIAFLISGIYSTIGIDGHHDGIMLKPSLDVSRGLILFKDTFNQYGALTIFLQALAINVFGEYLIVIRLLTAFFYSITALVIWKTWSELLPRYLVWLTVFLYIFLAPYFFWTFIPSPSVYALFFQILSIYFLSKFLINEDNKYLIISGISTSIAFWCKQPVGMFLFFAILGYFTFVGIFERKCKETLRRLFYYTLSYLSVSLFMMLILLFNGAIQDWWIQSIEYAYMFVQNSGGIEIKKIISCLFPTRPENRVFLVMPSISLLLFIKITIEAILLRGKLDNKNKFLLLIAITSMASWLQYYPVTSYWHRYWGSIPMIGLTVYFIHSLFIKRSRIFACTIVVFIIFVIFGKAVNRRMTIGYAKITQEYEKYETIKEPVILSGMQVSREESLFYRELDSYMKNFLEHNPSSYIINLTPDALWVTLGGNRKNFHKMYVNWQDIIETKYPEYETLVINNKKKALFLSNIQRDFPHWILIRSLRPAFFRIDAHHLRDFRKSLMTQPTGNEG